MDAWFEKYELIRCKKKEKFSTRVYVCQDEKFVKHWKQPTLN